MNSELIFHHYAGSPFSEKVRLIFGFKQLAWRSVTIPAIMPKPDVVALSGGYRKTPMLQIGADIYCDTALIAKVIDRLAPSPSLFPSEIAGTAQMLAQWADTQLFWTVIPYAMQPAGLGEIFAGQPPEVIRAFAADRAPFRAGAVRKTPLDAEAALRSHFGWLETHLADGRPYLVRGEASIADFAVAHCVWYVHRIGALSRVFDACPRLVAWYQGIAALGHGSPTPMSSAEAVERSAASRTQLAPTQVLPGLGFSAGDEVTVAATDYGRDPVAGTLVGLSNDEVVLRRDDERAGTVQVHFPRIDFQIKPLEAPKP